MSSDVTVAPHRGDAMATGRATRSAARPMAVDAAILLAAAAGLAHALSTPTHFRWWQASGVFFALITAAQIGLAAVLFFRWRAVPLLLAGIWSNVGVVCVYVASRLVALPGQPVLTAHHAPRAPGRAFLPAVPEGVGSFDMFALVVEVALVVTLLGLLPKVWRTRTSSALMWVGLGMCAFAVWAVMASGALS